MSGRRQAAAAITRIVISGLLIGLAHRSPPVPVSAAAAETEVSAERALEPLRSD